MSTPGRTERAHWLSAKTDDLAFLVYGALIVFVRLLNTNMSEGDLDEDLRKKGLQDAAKIAEARLERDGTLSVLK